MIVKTSFTKNIYFVVNTPGEKDLEIIEEITDLKHFKKGNKSESKK